MDEVAFFLKSHEGEIGCEVVYAKLETAKIIRKKSSTYDTLKEIIPTPIVYNSRDISASDLPIFSKPDIGYGSRGAQKIETIEDFNKLTPFQKENNIFTEFLPGIELTVDCFSDRESGLLFAGPRIRERTRIGISVASSPIPLSNEIKGIAATISAKLNMSGCWFFQVKRDINNVFKVQEVAARVSGSMAMYRLLGVNFILLEIYQRLGKKVSIPKLLRGDFRIERAFDVKLVGKLSFDSVYVDLDDCLIFRNQVNTDIISFIFGCRNNNIPVFLITRHAFNLEQTLLEFALDTIFDDIFHIKDGLPKSQYIKHRIPLFIDDSFAEREEVRNALNCHVASPDMIHMGLI